MTGLAQCGKTPPSARLLCWPTSCVNRSAIRHSNAQRPNERLTCVLLIPSESPFSGTRGKEKKRTFPSLSTTTPTRLAPFGDSWPKVCDHFVADRGKESSLRAPTAMARARVRGHSNARLGRPALVGEVRYAFPSSGTVTIASLEEVKK